MNIVKNCVVVDSVEEAVVAAKVVAAAIVAWRVIAAVTQPET